MPTPAITETPAGYQTAVAVTASDTIDLPVQANALLVAVAGNLSFVTIEDVVVNMTAAPVMILPIRVKRVRTTGTTATVYALN